jgi:hypothetical protein
MTQQNEADPAPAEEQIDWSLTTWEGVRREAMRRWAELPLERVIAALEEMQNVSEMLAVKDNESE